MKIVFMALVITSFPLKALYRPFKWADKNCHIQRIKVAAAKPRVVLRVNNGKFDTEFHMLQKIKKAEFKLLKTKAQYHEIAKQSREKWKTCAAACHRRLCLVNGCRDTFGDCIFAFVRDEDDREYLFELAELIKKFEKQVENLKWELAACKARN